MKVISSGFTPRPYQRDIMRAFFVEQKKRLLVVAHRRAGKDLLSFNILLVAALQRPGLYYHLLPKIGQSANVIWRGRGKDGKAFLDYIPDYFIRSKNHSTMSITLINGSIIRITGADNYEALIGSNPLGIVFSEIQSTDPRAWDYLRPVLTENGGWSIFIGTPRGHNHLYEMFEENKDNDSWYVKLLSAKNTTDNDGNPVITQEVIDEELRAGMPPDIIEQEFYCSFNAAIQGAYFAKEMAALKESGRLGEHECEPGLLVFTAWDLGVSDSTAIGLFQQHPDGKIVCFEHIEERGEGLEHYVQRLREVQQQYGFKRYGTHYVPHDIRVRELGTGRTRYEILARNGLQLRVVPRTSVQERIQCARGILPNVYINKRCKRLVRCLDEYHAKRDEKRGIDTGPEHDWTSHSADMFTYFAVGHLDQFDKGRMEKQMSYARLRPLG